MARAIFGADRVVSGEVLFGGRPLAGSPVASVERGIALVPESRRPKDWRSFAASRRTCCWLLPAIAAVLVGGTSLFGGLGSLVETLIGAAILTLVLNGSMNLLVIDSNWQPLVTGSIVLVAAAIDTATRRGAEAKW